MVGLVLLPTLLSPLVIGALLPLMNGSGTAALAAIGHTTRGGFALVGVVLPCAAGILCRLALPTPWLNRVLGTVVPVAPAGSLVLTYSNASGPLGALVNHPRPLLLTAALAVAATVCLLSFTLGRFRSRPGVSAIREA